VPDQVTYGATSYNRGADVAHTLRAYLGDELFFDCLKSYLNQYKFQAASSTTFRDHLSQCSGINLNDFFDDWVFNPGFATFSIDSFSVLNSSAPYQVQLFLRQKLNESDHYFNNVPLEITVLNNQWQRDVQKVMMSGPCAQVIINTNLNPQLLLLDEANRLSDASNGETRVIKQTGNANFSYGRMNLLISGITDSALLRIDHYYASPDRIKPEIDNLFISDYHYWRVSGIDLQKLQTKATVQYNGTTSTSQGYLDHTLITNSEDSLVLMYRPSSRHQWRIENDVVFTTGSVSDKKGSFTINQLKSGEYALAIYQANKTPDYTDTPDSCALFTNLSAPKSSVPLLMLIPSLTNTQLTTRVICENPSVLTIVNADGITMQTRQVSIGAHNYHTDVSQWLPGNYYVILTDKTGRTTKKFIVIK
jgi:aminopeptidase N